MVYEHFAYVPKKNYPKISEQKILVTGTLVFGLLPNLLLHLQAYMTVYHDYCI